MNEIQLIKPEVTYLPCIITYDFAELDKQIEQVDEMMQSIELDEANLPVIKVYMTSLNKLANALNDDKKDIKAKVAPELPIFEKECMARVNHIKSIREGMKAFTDEVARKKKQDRYNNVEAYLLEHREMDVPIDVIWNDEYYSMVDKKWQLDVDYKLGFIKSEYARLDDLALDDIPLMKSLFLKYWNYSQARDAYDDIKATEKRKAELLKEKEPAETIIEQPAEPATEEVCAAPAEQTTVKMVTISGSASVVEKGIEYLKSIGLKVEVY